MSGVALVLHQARYEGRVFRRNPAAVFFTVMLPVVFLLILATIFGDQRIDELGGLEVSTYYVPALLTLAIVSATMVSLSMSLVEARESGNLKRVRGTPLPGWAYVSARVCTSIVVALIMVVVVTAIGRLAYGVEVPTATLPALALAIAVGAGTFCCLGFALSAAIPSEEAAPAITNATVLPLYFLSGVFIPATQIPAGVLSFADAFPIRHLFEQLLAAYDPATSGAGFEWVNLAAVAAWGAVGLLIAMRAFRWEPRSG